MKEKLLKQVSFQDLETFTLVYELRSFTATAEKLGVNQSAISYTIDKLRRVFDDLLFYRQGGKVVATSGGEELATKVQTLLEDMANLSASTEFDPATASHTITLACNFYERQVLIPLLLRHLNQYAPNIRLVMINAMHQGLSLLKQAKADILLGPSRPEEHDYYCTSILAEDYLCIADPQAHNWRQGLSMADYLAAKHVTIDYGNQWKSPYLKILEAQGLNLNETHKVPSLAGLDQMLIGTNLISTVPARIAHGYHDQLSIATCPVQAPFEIYATWTKRTHNSAAHRWLRELIVGLGEQV